MALRLVTPPALEPLSPAEARDFARIETTEEDLLLARFIRAARLQAETLLGRALLAQTWAYSLDAFPVGALELPRPPLISVSSVKTYDAAAVPTTVSSSLYFVRAGDGEGAGGGLELVSGAAWPVSSTMRPSEGIVVEYVAGYGETPPDVPEDIRLWIGLRVGDFYRNRETQLIGGTAAEFGYVGSLLDPYRLRVFA